jgi:hypothetical protein
MKELQKWDESNLCTKNTGSKMLYLLAEPFQQTRAEILVQQLQRV